MNISVQKYAFRSVLFAYLLLLVILPLGTVYIKSFSMGWAGFWEEISNGIAVSAMILTIKLAILATIIQAFLGTLVAYVLVRYRFFGRRILNSVVDLPFALPTAVSSLMILLLLGPESFLGKTLAKWGMALVYNEPAIIIGMLFVTFPFVVRTVQPLLETLDPAEEEASHTLGAGRFMTFIHVLLPAIRPGIIGGSLLAFSRALAEFGAVVLIAGNLPGKTMVASMYIFGEIENSNPLGATAVSVVLLTFSFLLLWSANWLQRKGGK